MQRFDGLEEVVRDATSVVTVGTFDGVHRGHQAVIQYVQERAVQKGGTTTLVTFDPHPKEVVTGQAVPLLSTMDERAAACAQLGLDRLVVIPFTQSFAKQSPEAFVTDVLFDQIGLQEIVIGYDHGFGKGRSGDSTLMQALGEQLGFSVDIVPPQDVAEEVVSSSLIRARLEQGQVADATRLLGRRYSVAGTVVQGDQRGRTIGYPTANLQLQHVRKIVPKMGVYAVWAQVEGEDVRHPAMMNIGVRPTVGGTTLRLEVHLLDFAADLYGKVLCVEFVERIRDERKFSSLAALVQQLSKDEARCRALFLKSASAKSTR